MAAPAERLTARDTINHQPAATHGAMSFDGLNGISRTTWMKPAVPAEVGAQQQTIGLDNKYQEASHFLASFCQCRSRLRRNVSLSAEFASRFAIATISTGGSSAQFRRKESRTCRLIRLRPTAVAETLRETARPSRGWFISFRTASRVKKRSEDRMPSRNTRVKASGFSNRCWRGNRKFSPEAGFDVTDRAAPGPLHDARSALCDHLWSPCAHGIRGSAYGGGCWAGTFFS